MKTRYLDTALDERGVFTLALNRPDKHNAFNEDLIAEMRAVLDEIAVDEAVRAVLLRANGKHFCAGADLDWMRRMAAGSEEDNLRDAEALADLLHTLDTLPRPTIAQAHGAVRGGGCGLLCCCDLAIAADNATFAFSEARLGLIPATISPYVVRDIGEKNARRYFLTAEPFTATDAARIGLISETIAADKIAARVDALLASILANTQEALQEAKTIIPAVARRPITPQVRRQTSQQIAALRASKQARERINGFLDKR